MSEDHDVIQALLGTRGAGATPFDEEDADLLAAYVAGTLDAPTREQVEARLASDDTLRAAWLAVASQPQVVRTPARGHPLVMWFASAAALVAVVLGVWALSRPNPAPTLDRLHARLESLQERVPDLFFDVRVLTPGELAVGPRVVERGGLELRGPRGRIVETHPSLAWVLPLGATKASLRIEEEATGEVVLETQIEGERYAFPDQAPGLKRGQRFVWSVGARGSLGEVRGSALLEIASREQLDRLHAQLEALGVATDPNDDATSDPLDGLLAVHTALRANLWHEARTLLARVRPRDQDEREHSDRLRALIEARLGAG